VNIAASGHDIKDQIALANGASAGNDDQILDQSSIDGRFKFRQRVWCRSERNRDAAMLANNSRKRELVHIVELSGREGFTRLNDFVSCGQDRHARPGKYLNVCESHCCEGPDTAGLQDVAGAENGLSGSDIGPLGADVLMRSDVRENPNHAVGTWFGVFDHDDRVSPVRKWSSGGNLRALTGVDRVRRHITRVDRFNDPEDFRCVAAGVGRIDRANRIAVHCRPRKWWHITWRRDVLSQNPMMRIA
jgi:hypothetical protein